MKHWSGHSSPFPNSDRDQVLNYGVILGYFLNQHKNKKSQLPFKVNKNHQINQTGEPYFTRVVSDEPSFVTETPLSLEVDRNVLQYLTEHEHLFELACDARNKLDAYFDPQITEYFLRRTYDPETCEEGLILEIHTRQDFTSAMECLEKFDDEWWLDNMPNNGDKLVIDVIFA